MAVAVETELLGPLVAIVPSRAVFFRHLVVLGRNGPETVIL